MYQERLVGRFHPRGGRSLRRRERGRHEKFRGREAWRHETSGHVPEMRDACTRKLLRRPDCGIVCRATAGSEDRAKKADGTDAKAEGDPDACMSVTAPDRSVIRRGPARGHASGARGVASACRKGPALRPKVPPGWLERKKSGSRESENPG